MTIQITIVNDQWEKLFRSQIHTIMGTNVYYPKDKENV
jgi:hypothetical protein